MDYIYDNRIDLKNKKLYVMINCGFLEWEHNITALDIVKRWCYKTNIEYMGSLLIGAGEFIGNVDNKLISRPALKQVEIFSDHIKNSSKKEMTTGLKFVNQRIYIFVANAFWKKKCKLNNLKYNEVIE